MSQKQFKKIVLVGIFTATSVLSANAALTNCPDGGQCVVQDGTTVELDEGSSYVSNTDGNPVLKAAGHNSKISGTGLTIRNSADDYYYWMPLIVVQDGGSIHVTETDIQALRGIEVDNGQFVQRGGQLFFTNQAIDASDAQITLDTVTIKNTAGFSSMNAVTLNNSEFEAKSLDVQLKSKSAAAFEFDNSAVHMDGGTIHVRGDDTVGIQAKQGARAMALTRRSRRAKSSESVTSGPV